MDGTAAAAKKLLSAIGRAVIDGDGDIPWDIVLADLARRTGWTFSEIDREDAAQVLPALQGQSVRDILQRVNDFVDTQGAARLSEYELGIYANVLHLMLEED